MSPRERKSNALYQPVPGCPNLEINTKTGVYYVRKFRAGRGALFKSTRCKKKGMAKTIAEDMISDWLGLKQTGRRRIRMEQVLPEFLADCKAQHETLDKDGQPKRRISTYKKDQSFVKFLGEHFGEEYLDDLDEQYWANWLKGKGARLDRTFSDVAKYLSLVLAFALTKKYILRKPEFKNPDKHQPKFVVYENEEVQTFLKHADPVLKDLIILAAENPLRPHEIREMRWEYLTFEKDGRVVLRLPHTFTKTHKYRELELSPNSAKVLKRRRKTSESLVWVFPGQRLIKPLSDMGLSHKWREMLKSAGIKKRYLFHWLRHSTYSKLLLDAEIPVQLVSEAGGTSIRVLQQRYLKGNAVRTRAVSRGIRLKIDT